MISLLLFRPTFQRVKLLMRTTDNLKTQVLPIERDILELQFTQRLFSISNRINHLVNEMQSGRVQNFLGEFQCFLQANNLEAYYDYGQHKFILQKYVKVTDELDKVRMEIRNCKTEKIDHASIRKSLYFKELKDIDKYVDMKTHSNVPNFMRDMRRKIIENQLIDKKNPLGVPFHADKLRITLLLQEKIEVELSCHLGEITIHQVSGVKSIRKIQTAPDEDQWKKKYYYRMKGMRIPRSIQNTILTLCKNVLNLGEVELTILHKLAYVGGAVQSIERMLACHQHLCPLNQT